ncbi:MAG: hypothetical protein ACTSR8_07640 [Promethearchaeota archaeon]
MEDKHNEHSDKKKADVDKIRNYISQMAKGKPSPIEKSEEKERAKDQVVLKHVETKKQEVSKETLEFAKRLKNQVLEHDHFEELSNDEITILESFMGRRLLLTRIAIIVNQSRIPLGIEPLNKDQLLKILGSLVEKGYLETEKVNDNDVYWLTERGKYRVQ